MSDCAFCAELIDPTVQGPLKGKSRILWEDENFWVVPTLGCLTVGYLLLMPKDHYYSFGQMVAEDPAVGPVLDKTVRKLKSWIIKTLESKTSNKFALQVFVAEHGAVNSCVKGAQCCDHAHLHFIPLPSSAAAEMNLEYLRKSQDIDVLPNFAELLKVNSFPYILANRLFGTLLVWKDGSQFPSQWCRIVAAKVLGIPDKWNWKTHPFIENIEKTLAVFSGTSPER